MSRRYPINEIYDSIQGEGVHTGEPVTFVRLQGCAVGCPWCDTRHTWEVTPDTEFMTGVEIAERVGQAVAVITGGEPAEYPLGDLTGDLKAQGIRTHIETSGTAPGVLEGEWDWVVVSPKIGMPGGKDILLDVIGIADEIKMPIRTEHDLTALKENILPRTNALGVVVSLLPISQSKRSTALCVKACLENGWRLSAQVHKYLELP